MFCKDIITKETGQGLKMYAITLADSISGNLRKSSESDKSEQIKIEFLTFCSTNDMRFLSDSIPNK